jgi:hypothetical protein
VRLKMFGVVVLDVCCLAIVVCLLATQCLTSRDTSHTYVWHLSGYSGV